MSNPFRFEEKATKNEPAAPAGPVADQAATVDEDKAKRKRWRWYSLGYVTALGLLLIVFFRDWEIDGIHATYFGCGLLVLAVVGACGVNVWFGGPFDKRLDK